jgi:hypothetical protein
MAKFSNNRAFGMASRHKIYFFQRNNYAAETLISSLEAKQKR